MEPSWAAMSPEDCEPGEAERVPQGLGGEVEGAPCGRGRSEDADRALRVEARAEVRRADGAADSSAHLAAADERGKQGASVDGLTLSRVSAAPRQRAPTWIMPPMCTSSNSKEWTAVALTSAACGAEPAERCPRVWPGASALGH